MDNSFSSPLLPSSEKKKNRRFRTNRRDRVQEIELAPRSQGYQPPQNPVVVQGISVQPFRHDGHVLIKPHPSSRLDFHHTSNVNHSQHQHGIITNKNPAEDLAWNLCSHGFCCIQCVRTQEVGILENCGAFEEILGPGLYCGLWPFSCIVERLSLRVKQLDITLETKTKDNVFLHLTISVQFRVLVERAYDAYYRLKDTDLQIRTLVYDVVRSSLPRMDLDEVFLSRTEISDTVFSRLQIVMKAYGYVIVSTLVTRINPNDLVRFSMNEVNASKRIKEAIPHRAEADKYAKVKDAEGNAEALYLQGIGTAKMRSAVTQGLKTSFAEYAKDQSWKDAMDMLLVAQYLDTLVAVGAGQLLINSSPGEVITIQQNLHRQSPPSIAGLLCD